MTWHRQILLLGAVAAVLTTATGRAAAPVPEPLAAPVTATWTGLPLRQATDRLAEIGSLAVVLDRRIDPDTLVSIDVAGEPLAAVLDRLAVAAGGVMVPYAGHVRIVPRTRAAALAAADPLRADELRGLSRRVRTTVLATGTSSWPDGAVPRDLVAALATHAGIVIAGLDDIPHDHFPVTRLPSLPLADRVDLLLAHFDQRVEWKPRAMRASDAAVFPIVPIADVDAAAADTAAARPQPSPLKTAQTHAAQATYTLTVAAPLEELLATLARRFAVRLELDRDALAGRGVAPAEIVRLELKDATRDQLLDAILAPRGLAWRIDGEVLSVSAAPR